MNLFYTKRHKDSYEICLDSAISIEELADHKTIIFPCDIDTEYQRKHPLTDPTTRLQPTIVITNQLKAIAEPVGEIFAHPDIENIARHPVFKSGFSPIDYLQSLGEKYGFEVVEFTRYTGESAKSLHRTTNKKRQKIEALPVLEIVGYAFYAVAEIGKIATGSFKSDLVALTRAKKNEPRIEQKRRLRTVGKPNKEGFSPDYVNLPWSVKIEGVTYRIRFCFIDACAVHGIASYKDFCEATGIEVVYKDNFNKTEKGEMLRMYTEKPEDFDNYALGDLYNYDALMSNVTLFKTGYTALALLGYLKKIPLTIGSTIKDLLKAATAKEFNVSNNDKEIEKLLDKVCKPANANYLKLCTDTTLALNAKVRGGRCRNNRPTHTKAEGLLIDIDISGCYGEGQRNQLMIFGNPVKLHAPINEVTSKLLTLGEFIKQWESELVYGGWQAIVSSTEHLKHSQDFINSWIEPKNFREIAELKTDTDEIDKEELGDWLEKETGSTKIYNHQVINGLINHDTLDWINHVCSKHQRKELLEKLVVRTALIYPKSERVNSADELLETIDNWTEENHSTITIGKGRSGSIIHTKECHAWHGVNMGDFLITQLLIERKKYEKKTPLNTLYKLCINTLYGDLVSPYFTISNVVVGNNITARARALAWYMEKGFNGWQSITDGCVFDINKVCFPLENRALTGENVVNLYRENDIYKKHLSLKPLTNNGEITVERWEKTLDKDGKFLMDEKEFVYFPVLKIGDEIIEKSHDWINQKAWEHLQKVFPNVSILHNETTDIKGKTRKGMFVFEVKACYTKGVFHGTANYMLCQPDELEIKPVFKMRSYEKKKKHERYQISNGEIIKIDEHKGKSPAEVFLNNLLGNPQSMPRSITFMKEGILKCGEFSERFESTYSKTKLVPGDTIFKIGLLKELSLSQFTFQTREQCESWEREMESLKRKYGQSYEMFFIDKQGNLRYQEMIEAIDTAISEGKTGLGFKKKQCSDHPESAANELLKEKLEKSYQMDNEQAEIDYDNIVLDGYDYDDDSRFEVQEVEAHMMPGIVFEGELDLDCLDNLEF